MENEDTLKLVKEVKKDIKYFIEDFVIPNNDLD